MSKALLIQCIESEAYNVGVVPTTADNAFIITTIRNFIDTVWSVDMDNIELFRSEEGEVVNVGYEGHIDEAYFVISEVDLLGFE